MPLRSIASSIGKSVQAIGKIPFIFIPIALALFFYVNGGAFFPNWDSSYGNLIGAYLLMTIVFLFFSKVRTQKEVNLPLQIGVLSFVMAFFLTYIVLMILVKLNVLVVATDFPKEYLWQTLVIQICVVATAEELMFRGVILDVLTPGGKRISWFAIILSSILFAIWHSYAYQVIWYNLSFDAINMLSLLLAFVFGIILGIVAQNPATESRVGGLPACIGIHSVYNLIVIGAIII